MKLTICHLYGNLMNTYGDNGNLLMLQHRGKKMGLDVETVLVSIGDKFEPNQYDIVFFGGGQDYEQSIVSQDLQTKKEDLTHYIENNGVVLGICGGFQLLGHYYINAAGQRLEGIGAIDYYTLNQVNNRYIGDIEIHNDDVNETYLGYENHNGRTFLGPTVAPLGRVVNGFGNNNEDKTEGARYKNVFCSYFHGPLLVRNQHLADRIIQTAIKRKDRQ
ncbi:type 1 glutamine amidotransferase [Granulicatella seriolae]|uniref:Lipid II isoglutaminyl synthase (glutamine-hydrolyzing) subunit GatD n=1 Tax=Granulicatella seriolae TaxID=2967226 RepID=A0ABT1WMC1_9LACT|nr:adenosylcobyric acid synthase [Granulicatella seriolae]